MIEEHFPLKVETHTIIGICMEIHRILGKGLFEIVYKDALEYEFKTKAIVFEREKEYSIQYKDIILPHKFFADFIVFGSIILEVKAQKNLIEDHYNQMINYLAISNCKVGLLVNFGESSLKFKRVIFKNILICESVA
ncbi:MAG TPA: GxxExxY protein [Bacteroidetes bacterium]|nr:GxxExxY protein [Bacteroidota bacterium]